MNELRLKVPGFAYPGGKVRLRPWLVGRMPLQGQTYLEPFAGRGNVFWLASQMLGFDNWHLNDPWTARWFELLRDFDLDRIPKKISKELGTRLSRRAVSHRSSDDLAVILEPKCRFSGGMGGCPISILSIYRRDLFIKQILRSRHILELTNAQVTNLSYEKIDYGAFSERDFVYFDPPYLNHSGIYAKEQLDHEHLLSVLCDVEFLWMISGFEHELYLDILGKPSAKKIRKITLYQVELGQEKRSVVECIWTNYRIGPNGIARRRKVIRAKR